MSRRPERHCDGSEAPTAPPWVDPRPRPETLERLHVYEAKSSWRFSDLQHRFVLSVDRRNVEYEIVGRTRDKKSGHVGGPACGTRSTTTPKRFAEWAHRDVTDEHEIPSHPMPESHAEDVLQSRLPKGRTLSTGGDVVANVRRPSRTRPAPDPAKPGP